MIFILNAFWNFLAGGTSARGMDKERVVLLPRLPLSKAQPEAWEPEASEEGLIHFFKTCFEIPLRTTFFISIF